MMQTETIAEVGLDEQRRLFVRPASGDFEYIYRAGMEVYWDPARRTLFHPEPQREWSPAQWFRQIFAAAAGEYGVRLKLTDETVWSNVSDQDRADIEKLCGRN